MNKRTFCSVEGCRQVATAVVGNVHYCSKHDPSNLDTNPFEQKPSMETETYKAGGVFGKCKGTKNK